MTENKIKNGSFEVISSADSLRIDLVDYYISIQKITQENGNFSNHLVLKKQPINEDGSPRGVSRQLFIPLDHSKEVITKAAVFLTEQED